MYKVRSMLIRVLHRTTVLVQLEIVHEPICGSNIGNVFSLVFEVLLPDPPGVLGRFSHWASAEL